MSSFRRFLYLAADDGLYGTYSLRRIDVSRLFFPTPSEGTPSPLHSNGGGGAGHSAAAADPSTVEDAGPLPDPIVSLSPSSHPEHIISGMEFMLFKNNGSKNGRESLPTPWCSYSPFLSEDEVNTKVVALDNKGYCLTVNLNPNLPQPTVRAMPSLSSSKCLPFSFTIGQSLYAMDSIQNPPNGERHSFEVLSYGAHGRFKCIKDWQWKPLDPHPVACSIVDSCAVVAGTNIVVSSDSKKACAHSYCFGTVKKKWDHAVNWWALPFDRVAEYVPEHKLWFGISRDEDGYRFSAANLVGASSDSGEVRLRVPDVHGLWKEYSEPPPEWTLAGSYSVYLGSSRFCIARFFEIGKIYVCPESHHSYKREEELQVVLTGVEVESGGEGLCCVHKHKSQRYKLDVRDYPGALNYYSSMKLSMIFFNYDFSC